mgnify:FL=1
MNTENRFLIMDNQPQYGMKAIIKSCLYKLKSVYYSFLSAIYQPVKDEEKLYNVSILAIFKNEAKYLKEWIEFHKIVGVEHFYLYNNNSDDDYLDVLQPYIDEGIVTLIQWPQNQAQMECYNDGILRFRNESKWIAIIDIDEFIVPNSTDNVYDFLKDFENKPAVIGYWKYFGASGKLNRPADALVVEDFVVAWRKYADIGKCFYNTKYDFDIKYKGNNILHHFMWASYKGHALPPVNVFGKICLPGRHKIPYNAQPDHFPLQINHYFTKSYQEYIDKKSKGDVYFKENPHTLEYFHEHDMLCQQTDYHAYKYLVKLKLAMDKNV